MDIKVLALGAHKEIEEMKNTLKIQHNVILERKSLHDTTISIINNEVSVSIDSVDLNHYDFIWINSSWKSRTVTFALNSYLKQSTIDFTPVEYEASKLGDMVDLALDGVNVPNTFFCYTSRIKSNIAQIEKVCSYPLIVKVIRGSLGKGVFYVESKKELIELTSKLDTHKKYIFQSFIPNTHDYRVITSRDEVMSADKRVRQDDEFRNNAFLGAEEIFFEIETMDPKLKHSALKASKALALKWSGVDLIKSTFNNEYYVIEVNRRPGMTAGSSETTAAMKHIVKLLGKKEYLE